MEHNRRDTSHQPKHNAGWKTRFQKQGVEAILGDSRGRLAVFLGQWVLLVVRWVTEKTPRDFGFLRSRWFCVTAAFLLWEEHRFQINPEMVRRWLCIHVICDNTPFHEGRLVQEYLARWIPSPQGTWTNWPGSVCPMGAEYGPVRAGPWQAVFCPCCAQEAVGSQPV